MVFIEYNAASSRHNFSYTCNAFFTHPQLKTQKKQPPFHASPSPCLLLAHKSKINVMELIRRGRGGCPAQGVTTRGTLWEGHDIPE